MKTHQYMILAGIVLFTIGSIGFMTQTQNEIETLKSDLNGVLKTQNVTQKILLERGHLMLKIQKQNTALSKLLRQVIKYNKLQLEGEEE